MTRDAVTDFWPPDSDFWPPGRDPPAIAHFKSIKRASDKRYREKKKAAKAAVVVGCKD